MTHAYDKICLDRAADTLGRMLDYSVYTLHFDIGTMIDLFIASGIASLFCCGDIRTTAGKCLKKAALHSKGLSRDIQRA